MISGFLTKDSPLRAIFPTGIVPLTTPHPMAVILGKSGSAPVQVYMLSVRECAPVLLDAMAKLMAETSGGDVTEAREFLNTSEVVPIRAVNITGTGMPLRNFI